MATGDKLVTLDGLKTVYDKNTGMVAPTEASTTASAAHSAGSYFILGGVLYEATADIASGGTIITSGNNANCKVATGGLGADVADLKSAVFSRYVGKKISIIGDSIDTFDQAGYKIDGYRMYYPALDVTDVKQTWWYQFIAACGAKLEINASWSGSRVTDTHSDPTYPDFYDRVTVIGSPDLILVTLGTNDSSNSVALGDYDFETTYTSLSESQFRPAYIKGIKGLQATYPNADIICISEQMGDAYKESVRYIALTLGCTFVDASDYVGSSGVHPGPYGMDQIARFVLFPTDEGLNQRHFPADANATGASVNALRNAVNELTGLIVYYPEIEIEQGGVSNKGINLPSTDTTNQKRLRSAGYFDLEPGEEYKVVVETSLTGLEYTVSYYTANDFTTSRIGNTDYALTSATFTPPATTKYGRIIFAKSNHNSTISTSDVTSVQIKPVEVTPVMETLDAHTSQISALSDDVEEIQANTIVGATYTPTLAQGGFTEYGLNVSSNKRVRSAYMAVHGGMSLSVSYTSEKTLLFGCSFYTADDFSTPRMARSDFLPAGTYHSVPYGARFCRVLVMDVNNTDITPSDITALTVTVLSNNDAFSMSFNTIGANYAVGPDFTKRYVQPIVVGELTYLQSFCKYNGKYYSTNGSYIGVQNADMSADTAVELSVGHGNSMQLGTLHANYAYISGWNDQSVYVVDLDNLTIVDTITLPTTGYTTCAIDDVNEIAYIFQRDTSPSTETYYNFIVYDYANEEIISRKKLLRPFGAMQACDFVDGKIFVLNGLGTDAVPNHFLIYNTHGDIIGEYVMNGFNRQEPEGVFVDRQTFDVYFSIESKFLFKIPC